VRRSDPLRDGLAARLSQRLFPCWRRQGESLPPRAGTTTPAERLAPWRASPPPGASCTGRSGWGHRGELPRPWRPAGPV